MQHIVTLPERKAAEAARRAAAVEALVPVLAAYAKAHGGRFLLFGSAARGAMKFDSDVDLLMDFRVEMLSEAWKFAEAACWDLGAGTGFATIRRLQAGVSVAYRPRCTGAWMS